MEGGRRHGKLQSRPENREVIPEVAKKTRAVVSLAFATPDSYQGFVAAVCIRVSLQRYRKPSNQPAPLGAGRYQHALTFERIAAINSTVVKTSIPYRSPPCTIGPPMASNSSSRQATRSFCMELRIAEGMPSKTD